MVERRPRRKPLVLASTQALLDSLPGDRRGPPPEPVRLKAGVLRFPARSSGSGCGEFGELASFVALPASALRRLAVVTGTPVRTWSRSASNSGPWVSIGWLGWEFDYFRR